ncbi:MULTISPECIES: GIY-YIG nuclease family protein [unclassified Azospirillum]|uniref:GIY-YIG nuclease family protein n=1 Tax=unclassified Azospirillum TaxID=2630922 RepID=UPI000D646FF1|nr:MULTISPECIES: GIY-YIG nuclease family protein [unclassified Azospirillum]
MGQLTNEQRRFLLDQKIPLSMVFDATGMKRSEYKEAMKSLNKHFAFGVSPCEKGGHTLRSRAGNCIQCDTANIAFQKRSYKDGHVYLAGSPSKKTLKVGVTSDMEPRIKILNHYRYGDANDWEYLISAKTEKAGDVEFSIHAALVDYSVEGHYYREGKKTQCYELFSCGYVTARSAMVDIMTEKSFKVHSPESRSLKVYW